MSDKYRITTKDGSIIVRGPNNYYHRFESAGDWATSTHVSNFIQNDVNTALIRIEEYATKNGLDLTKFEDEQLVELHLTPKQARELAMSREYRAYMQGAPDALAPITDRWNFNQKYALAPCLYGLPVRIEGVRYPPAELVKLIATTISNLQKHLWQFEEDCRKFLVESTKEEEPFAIEGE